MASDHVHTQTSPTLLNGVMQHDPVAWNRFAALYTPLVYRWCRRAALQDSDASDTAQEVFRAVARSVGRFRHGESGQTFRGWLWTITRNKIRDHHRTSARQPGAMGGSVAHGRMLEIPDLPEDGDEASGIDTTAMLAHRALQLVRQDFASHTWQAFERLVLHNEAAADIAGDLGMSVGAVHTARWRVLKRLQEEMGGLL